MNSQFKQSNILMQQCLALSDDVVKKHTQGHDVDESLTRLSKLAATIPSDASHAHVQLFDSFSQGSFSLKSGRAEPQLALNPAHKVAGHWDSTNAVGVLCGGMIHGGILTLDGAQGPERFLLAGGCIHSNNGLYKRGNRREKYFHRFSGIGLTVKKLDDQLGVTPLVTTKFGLPNLDDYAFGDKGWAYFENMIRSSKQEKFCGRFYTRNKKNHFKLIHLLRTREIDQYYSKIKASSRSSKSPFYKTKNDTLDVFTRKDQNYPRIRDANQPRNPFSDRFSDPSSDPFSPWFSPTFKDDLILHQTPYLRVISPSPSERPAIITYVVGHRHILHHSRESYGHQWQDSLRKEEWSTRMALV